MFLVSTKILLKMKNILKLSPCIALCGGSRVLGTELKKNKNGIQMVIHKYETFL